LAETSKEGSTKVKKNLVQKYKNDQSKKMPSRLLGGDEQRGQYKSTKTARTKVQK
jgi:hypothetical protein